MGFPTANVRYSQEYRLPKKGVYAGFAIVNAHQYKAMINIGHNPTLNYRQTVSIEAHLIGFKGDIYGKYIRIYPLYYLRPEIRFQNRDNLSMQLYQDRRTVISVLKDYDTIIEFNGDRFDLPYLREKYESYGMGNPFDGMRTVDLYQELRPFKSLLCMSRLSSEISSRNSVPPSTASNRPIWPVLTWVREEELW